MRAIHRVVLLAVFAAFTSALTACSDFDPDKLDVFGLNEKKKLPGERKELFPQGVPGVTQGIPPEYKKGNQPTPDTAQTPLPGQNQTGTSEADKKTAAVEPEPKPKQKRPPKPRTASQPPPQVTVQRAPQQQQAPWPQQDQQPAQGQSPWPAQGQNNASAPWPASPQPGTFSR